MLFLAQRSINIKITTLYLPGLVLVFFLLKTKSNGIWFGLLFIPNNQRGLIWFSFEQKILNSFVFGLVFNV